VIAELRDEFSTHPGAPDGDGGAIGESAEALDNLPANALLGRPDPSAESRRIEARLARVEQTVSAALDVVNQLAQTIQPDSQSEDNPETLQ